MRGAHDNLMHLLVMVALQRRAVLLDLRHDRLDVGSQHLGREAQLAHGEADDAVLLAVVVGAGHLLEQAEHVAGDGLHAHAGHEALGPQDAAHVGLGQLVGGALVADERGQLDGAVAQGLEERLLAHGHGARCARLDGQRGPFLADDADAAVRLDRVRQADAALDHGAGLEGLEVDGEVVLGREGVLADLEGAGVPVEQRLVSVAFWVV